MRRTSVSRKIFVICNTTFLITMALLCLLPLVNLFAISLSGKSAANSGAVLQTKRHKRRLCFALSSMCKF